MCLPNLLCVGAEKSGTTSIYNILKKNKNIYAIRKETEFFTYFNKEKPKNYYVNNLNEYKSLFKKNKKEKYLLDVSTTYLPSDDAINNILHLCDDPKIIICLRNPINRAYSRYWMAAKTNSDLIKISFEKFKFFFLNHNSKNQYNWNNIRYRGFYHEQIQKYYNKFDKKKILVIFYEDLQDKKNLELKLSNFLGININSSNEIFAESLYSENKIIHKLFNFSFNFYIPETKLTEYLKIIYRKLRKKFLKKYPEISDEIKEYLKNIYLEDIKKTEKLLNVDLKKWYE